ncbi:MAG: hypothetical protein BWK78_01925 [Thiotrichaceae bacterium IS1]|nr:MAG: hypothetical protein BWK78_01925 [Thiotrichaceae bacterium IS1]
MPTISESHLKEFLKSIKDRPLEAGEPFYVQHFQEDNDPIKELYHHITRDDDMQSVALLSGFRGNGKSTELRRLKVLLEHKEYAVVLCDMEPFFDEYEPVKVTDFLISVALALNEAMRKQYGEDFLQESYLKRFLEFLKTELILENVGEGYGFLVNLVKEPTLKMRLQNALSTKIESFVREMRHFFDNIRIFLQNRGYKQTVLLLDSFEKIRGIGENAHQLHESVDDLFRRHVGDKLQLPNWHVVYTVPPYVTSVAGSQLGICTFLPNIHVLNKDGSHDGKGIEIMKEVIKRRFDWPQVFTNAQMERVILATAGSFRVFFRLIRTILLKVPEKNQLIEVPVTPKLIERAENDFLRDMTFLLPTEDKEWLKKIEESKKPEVSVEIDKVVLMKFMDKDWVFLYHNGKAWFDVNPLLKRALD